MRLRQNMPGSIQVSLFPVRRLRYTRDAGATNWGVKNCAKINAARASHPGRIARGMFRAYSSLEAMRCVLLKPHSGECCFWAHSARCWLQIIHPEMVTCNSRPAVIDSSQRLGPAISGGPSEEAATPGHRNAQSAFLETLLAVHPREPSGTASSAAIPAALQNISRMH